jgi:uncharacterized caspase-like protein
MKSPTSRNNLKVTLELDVDDLTIATNALIYYAKHGNLKHEEKDDVEGIFNLLQILQEDLVEQELEDAIEAERLRRFGEA